MAAEDEIVIVGPAGRAFSYQGVTGPILAQWIIRSNSNDQAMCVFGLHTDDDFAIGAVHLSPRRAAELCNEMITPVDAIRAYAGCEVPIPYPSRTRNAVSNFVRQVVLGHVSIHPQNDTELQVLKAVMQLIVHLEGRVN